LYRAIEEWLAERVREQVVNEEVPSFGMSGSTRSIISFAAATLFAKDDAAPF
jgi:hypothetical protein